RPPHGVRVRAARAVRRGRARARSGLRREVVARLLDRDATRRSAIRLRPRRSSSSLAVRAEPAEEVQESSLHSKVNAFTLEHMPSQPETPRRRRSTKGNETRERIFAAAIERFQTHGYSAAALRSIAEDAGVAPGLLYRYFDGKDAVV